MSNTHPGKFVEFFDISKIDTYGPPNGPVTYSKIQTRVSDHPAHTYGLILDEIVNAKYPLSHQMCRKMQFLVFLTARRTPLRSHPPKNGTIISLVTLKPQVASEPCHSH